MLFQISRDPHAALYQIPYKCPSFALNYQSTNKLQLWVEPMSWFLPSCRPVSRTTFVFDVAATSNGHSSTSPCDLTTLITYSRTRNTNTQHRGPIGCCCYANRCYANQCLKLGLWFCRPQPADSCRAEAHGSTAPLGDFSCSCQCRNTMRASTISDRGVSIFAHAIRKYQADAWSWTQMADT